MIIFIRKIGCKDLQLLDKSYKDVFSGYPWYEDLACINCKAIYTNREVREDSKDRVIRIGNFDRCLKCNEPLNLVPYYPNIIDNRRLIKEALCMESFIGYIALINDNVVGFSWGYKIPNKRTTSVNFPEVTLALRALGISKEQAFYGAETGVVEKYQGQGLGRKLVSLRTRNSFEQGFKIFLNRTINPRMRKILQSLFSGIEPRTLFKDPETGSQWFLYDFKNYNQGISK